MSTRPVKCSQPRISLICEQYNLTEEILRDRFIHQTTSLPDGHFHQLHQLEEVNLASYMIMRSGLHCCVICTGLDG